jgi:hypothetical protein
MTSERLMSREEFIGAVEKIYEKGVEIIRAKNQDYGGTVDPFKNFRGSLIVGVPIERGILVRILDKITRASNLIDRPPAVVDEKIEDTILDAINYLAIMMVFLSLKEDR